MKKSVFSCFVLAVSLNSSYANDLAFPGFTGVLRTPTAEIAPIGSFNYQYNNTNDLNTDYDETYNVVFTVGVDSNVELGGRLTDWYDRDRQISDVTGYLPGVRDLSGNAKFKFPSLGPASPDLAVGMTDFAGLAVNFKTAYGVATKKVGKAQFSVGYAKTAGSNKRAGDETLSGAFANFKYDLLPSLSLMSDYVSKEFSAGFRYKLDVFNMASLSILAMSQKEENDWDNRFGLTLSVPLDFNKKKPSINSKEFVLKSGPRNVDKFIDSLQSKGFTNVQVGVQNGTEVVAFENHLFNHNYIDPISIVLSNAYRYLGPTSRLRVVTMKQATPIFAIEIDRKHYAQYINSNGVSGAKIFKSSSKAWNVASNYTNNVKWIKSQSTVYKRPLDIRIKPEIDSVVGTEFGLYDYSLGVTTSLNIPVSKGVNVVTSATLPVSNSENYEDGGVFSRRQLISKLNQVAVQKFFKPTSNVSLLTAFGYAAIGEDDFTTGELVGLWQPGSGKNQVSARLTHMKANDENIDDETIALVSYKRDWNEKDLSAAITYGQHYNEDRGVSLVGSRYFGDTEFSLYFKSLATDDVSGGISVGLPLTPRKDNKIGRVVVRGTQYLGYGVETTIKDPEAPTQNRLRYDMLMAPGFENSLGIDIYDRLRITPDHFLNNLQQLRLSTISLAGD